MTTIKYAVRIDYEGDTIAEWLYSSHSAASALLEKLACTIAAADNFDGELYLSPIFGRDDEGGEG